MEKAWDNTAQAFFSSSKKAVELSKKESTADFLNSIHYSEIKI
jgi:hypothetical protein